MARLRIGAISIEIIPVLDFIVRHLHRLPNLEKNIDMKDVGIFAIIQIHIAFGLIDMAGDVAHDITAGEM